MSSISGLGNSGTDSVDFSFEAEDFSFSSNDLNFEPFQMPSNQGHHQDFTGGFDGESSTNDFALDTNSIGLGDGFLSNVAENTRPPFASASLANGGADSLVNAAPSSTIPPRGGGNDGLIGVAADDNLQGDGIITDMEAKGASDVGDTLISNAESTDNIAASGQAKAKTADFTDREVPVLGTVGSVNPTTGAVVGTIGHSVPSDLSGSARIYPKVKIGDVVEKGDVLGQVYSEESLFNIETAEVNLENAKDKFKSEYGRTQVVTAEKVENLEQDLTFHQGELKNANVNLTTQQSRVDSLSGLAGEGAVARNGVDISTSNNLLREARTEVRVIENEIRSTNSDLKLETTILEGVSSEPDEVIKRIASGERVILPTSELQDASAEIRTAKAEIATAENRITDSTVISTVDGVVTAGPDADKGFVSIVAGSDPRPWEVAPFETGVVVESLHGSYAKGLKVGDDIRIRPTQDLEPGSATITGIANNLEGGYTVYLDDPKDGSGNKLQAVADPRDPDAKQYDKGPIEVYFGDGDIVVQDELPSNLTQKIDNTPQAEPNVEGFGFNTSTFETKIPVRNDKTGEALGTAKVEIITATDNVSAEVRNVKLLNFEGEEHMRPSDFNIRYSTAATDGGGKINGQPQDGSATQVFLEYSLTPKNNSVNDGTGGSIKGEPFGVGGSGTQSQDTNRLPIEVNGSSSFTIAPTGNDDVGFVDFPEEIGITYNEPRNIWENLRNGGDAVGEFLNDRFKDFGEGTKDVPASNWPSGF